MSWWRRLCLWRVHAVTFEPTGLSFDGYLRSLKTCFGFDGWTCIFWTTRVCHLPADVYDSSWPSLRMAGNCVCFDSAGFRYVGKIRGSFELFLFITVKIVWSCEAGRLPRPVTPLISETIGLFALWRVFAIVFNRFWIWRVKRVSFGTTRIFHLPGMRGSSDPALSFDSWMCCLLIV